MDFTTLWPLLLMLVLIFLNMPVAFALGVAGVVGLFSVAGPNAVMGVLATSPYRDIATFSLSTVPLYLLMAEFIIQSKLAEPLFDAAYKWFGRVPGGVGIATIFADAGFGAMSGSSTAAAATMGKVAYPEMVRLGYSKSLASGIITVGGTLAILIPPSIAMVVYGLATETSISKLFIAGILPGIIMTLLYALAVAIWCIVKKEGRASEKFSWREKFAALRPVWPVVLLVFIVVFFLYAGIATATEVGAVGAMVAMLLGFALGNLKFDGVKKAVLGTIKGTAMIQTIILGAKVFGYYITLTNFTQKVGQAVAVSGVGKYGVLAFAVVLYIFLGMIMNNTAILFLTLPITFPLMMQFGYDPIWFGILCTVLGEIGLVSPPVGLNAYMASAACDVPLNVVFKGSLILLIVPVLIIALLIAFPQIALWLPSMMG